MLLAVVTTHKSRRHLDIAVADMPCSILLRMPMHVEQCLSHDPSCLRRTETAEFSKDDLYVARYDPIQSLLKEGWVHLI